MHIYVLFKVNLLHTRWSKLKHTYSELSIYQVTERKRPQNLEHTIQNGSREKKNSSKSADR